MSVVVLVIACLIWLLVKIVRIGKRESSLPPGPPTIPVLGNLHLLPKAYSYLKFTEWAQQYGGILSLKLCGSNLVILTDTGAVKELMDKRSASTSDRPPRYFADLVTNGIYLIMARYAMAMRLRKAVHMILSPEVSNRHIPIQTAETKQLLFDILNTPEAAYSHIARFSTSIVMSVVFGKRCPRSNTEHLKQFYEEIHVFTSLLEIGAHPPVDLIPALRYVPERWAPWKMLCRQSRSLKRQLYFGLLEECEDRLRRGAGNGCYMEDIIEKQEELSMDREAVGYLGGNILAAGSITTTSVLQSLLLVLIEFPETQRKAQEEIDCVVGDERAPMLEDVPQLPYIQALIKETHRFRPSVPLGIPHASIKDEEYLGYVIPKDTTIVINTWGIFHDPTLFDRPDMFNPDRYLLTEHGTIPGVDDQHFRSNLIFGAGRRICPGITLGNNSLMLAVMHLIWAFDFSDAVHMGTGDPVTTGSPVPTDLHNYTKGFTTDPLPFKCNIKARSKDRADIIKQQFLDVVDTFVKFEDGLDQEEKSQLAAHRVKVGS